MSIIGATNLRQTSSASTLSCSNRATLNLKDVLFRHHAIIGRGTCVVRADSDFPAWKGKPLVVKISFTATTRPSEGSYLKTILKHADDSGDVWVKEHLPDMLHFETLSSETAMSTQSCLSRYMASVESSIDPKDRMGHEMRNFQILVTTELQSIKELEGGQELKEALTGIVRCYSWVYEQTGILHRDISVENLMYRHKTGKIVGVLNDFDLAIHKCQQNNGPLSKQRAGTKPFMAIDLLQEKPCPHFYRHDLESIMYVTVVLTCYRLASKETKDKSRISDWFNPQATSSSILASKREFLRGGKTKRPVVTESMQDLSELVNQLYSYFSKMDYALYGAELAGTEDQLDQETLGIVKMKDFAAFFGIV